MLVGRVSIVGEGVKAELMCGDDLRRARAVETMVLPALSCRWILGCDRNGHNNVGGCGEGGILRRDTQDSTICSPVCLHIQNYCCLLFGAT